MAKKTPVVKIPVGENIPFYSYLRVYKARRRRLFLCLLASFAICTLIIGRSLLAVEAWEFRLGPIFLACLPLIFLPLSEEWHYKTWEAKPRRYEKMMLD